MAIISTLRKFAQQDDSVPDEIYTERPSPKELKKLVKEIEHHNDACNTFIFQGCYPMARKSCETAIAGILKLQEQDPNLTDDIYSMYTMQKIDLQINLAICHNAAGEAYNAAAVYRECCTQIRDHFDVNVASIWQTYGICCMGLADAHLQRNQLAESRKVMEDYRLLVVKRFGLMRRSLILAMQQFKYHMTRGLGDQALELARESLQIYKTYKSKSNAKDTSTDFGNRGVLRVDPENLTKNWDLNMIEVKNIDVYDMRMQVVAALALLRRKKELQGELIALSNSLNYGDSRQARIQQMIQEVSNQ